MSSSKPIPPSINHTPIAHVGRIIAIASGKGGVGKSTTTVNLAHALTLEGKRVGILDADIYGPSIPRMLQLDTKLRPEMVDGQMIPPISYGIRAMSIGLVMGDQAAILRAPMITKALVQMLRLTRWGTAEVPLDYLLVDMPPGTGDINLSLAQNVKLDGAMIVTTPQEVSVMDARKALHAMRKLGVPILGVIENMSYFTDPAGTRHALFGEGGGKQLAISEGTNFLGEIPINTTLRADADDGQQPEKEALLPYIKLVNHCFR
ncbi:MAG: Mrp/NBP35 family ATP-binding protein [Rickettsiales bacterium]